MEKINRVALSLSSIHDNQISDKVVVIKNPTKEKVEDAVKKMEPTITSVLTNNFDPIKNPKMQIKAFNKHKQMVYVDIHAVQELGLDHEQNETLLILDESNKPFLISNHQLDNFIAWYCKKQLGKEFKEYTLKTQKKKITIASTINKKKVDLQIQSIALDSFLL